MGFIEALFEKFFSRKLPWLVIGIVLKYILDAMKSKPALAGPSDPAFKLWTDTIQSAANEAKRRGLAATDFYLDVWNEPNAQHKVQCLVNSTTGPPCVFDANLTQSAFFKIWDVAHRTLREAFPGARLVGPSLADGGPGLYGFERSVFPWLQAFLQHTHAAGTSPDVLTWHVSTLHQNASALVEHHQMLKVWAILILKFYW